MNEYVELITNNGAGVISLALIFYFIAKVIPQVTPTIVDIKTAIVNNVNVIENNTSAINEYKKTMEILIGKIDNVNEKQKWYEFSMETHNDRTIRLEQSVNILLDRNGIDK